MQGKLFTVVAGLSLASPGEQRHISRRSRRNSDPLPRAARPSRPREPALDPFNAFGSTGKSLHAHMGGHTGVPPFAGQDAPGFFARHLK
jgi:hypothetical protein